ncbi:hypothetical protein [Sinimarinibacterium thermocellulolyticum]|jgi:hypothetical protein|uniref:Uncharacterized protein n=1 Tax=Sinimarinibacterium thermocellulolyticum TaxID=3170016 RepID=A0ABV2A8W9_9GAMM
MTAEQRARFAREIRLRRRAYPDQMLRVLQDHAGWYYVLRLAGTPDFGPYLLDEITDAFDVEPEPISVHELDPLVRENSDAAREAVLRNL